MKNVSNINQSINLKNIMGVAKYSFKTLRIMYLIEVVLLVLALSSSTFISRFTMGLDLIPTISILLTMNFISHIIIFSMQLSKEYGKLLFLTPVTGIEFIVGNFLELILVNLFSIILVNISAIVNSGGASKIISICFGIFIGTITAYLIITALIAILSTYIRSTALCVLAVIIASMLCDTIYSFISKIILYFLPYFYLTIGNSNSIEIDIFAVILGCIALVILQFIAANKIDKKLDII